MPSVHKIVEQMLKQAFRPATLLERDSKTGDVLGILRTF